MNGCSQIKVKKFGEIINKKSIPLGIANNNINGPVVFRRPDFFPIGSKWMMYFAHHIGHAIRVAESDNLLGGWVVKETTILELNKIPGFGHVASPEVVIFNDRLELFYHCGHGDFQYTFKATTKDGKNWQYNKEVQGCFYFRLIGEEYAIAKYRNEGGVWYQKENNKFVEKGRLLPRMRHCCYCDGKLYWSEIGDEPECIYRADLNLSNFSILNKEKVLIPSEPYEITNNSKPSKAGAATGVTEVRDPFVIQYENKKFIYYTVRGEEAIAVAGVLD
jgi:hypothetical protein